MGFWQNYRIDTILEGEFVTVLAGGAEEGYTDGEFRKLYRVTQEVPRNPETHTPGKKVLWFFYGHCGWQKTQHKVPLAATEAELHAWVADKIRHRFAFKKYEVL